MQWQKFFRSENSSIYLRISIFMMLANETINPRANLQFALSTEHFASKSCACAKAHKSSPQNKVVTLLKAELEFN